MHIAFLNPQGNFDAHDSYWTEHPDFGGQLVYVKELSIALSTLGHKVDIITRQIVDNNWPEFAQTIDSYPGIDNLRIIRIPCGGENFLAKEQLWPYLREYVQGIIDFYEQEDTFPAVVTTHYGDGGLSGVLLQKRKNIPFTFTGHSLGAQKMDKLNVNEDNFNTLTDHYNFHLRIIAERLAMNRANKIIVSTSQERFQQYNHRLYNGAIDVKDDNKFSVIPPGVNTDIFNGQYNHKLQKKVDKYLQRDLKQNRLHLPCLISASRLDQKKNHLGLVKAFANSEKLQENANLVITLRGIENPFNDYTDASKEEREILADILNIYKKYQLEGKISMFPLNSQQELAEFYGYMKERKSVFTLTSFYEPFGLAPIEAMSSGLPVAITENGGPLEITDHGKYGILIDPENPENIAQSLLKLLTNKNKWHHYQQQGKKRVLAKYTWQKTAEKYYQLLKNLKFHENKGNKLPVADYYLNPNKNNEDKMLKAFKYLWQK